MLVQFKKIYMKNTYEMLKKKLMKVAEEFNLDYDELERAYLQEIKDYIEKN
jgi:hypothetical protein